MEIVNYVVEHQDQIKNFALAFFIFVASASEILGLDPNSRFSTVIQYVNAFLKKMIGKKEDDI